MTKHEFGMLVTLVLMLALICYGVVSLIQAGNEAAAYVDQHGIRGMVEHIWCGKDQLGCLSK